MAGRNKQMSKYPVGDRSFAVLREQLRLFAFDGAPSAPDVVLRAQQGLSKRERLAALLEGELNFHGEDSGYASHNLHAFAAKFPPQLPRAFIRGLTLPGEIVLDPMVGSGTTIVEALLEGRRGIGLDLDPLASQLSHVKTMPLDVDDLRRAGYGVLSRANALLDEKATEQPLAQQFDKRTREFIDYWFLPTTQRELMALVLAIRDVTDPPVRRFLELTFSSIIVTKSGGVSLARDLAHTRPHLDKNKVPKNALEQFHLRLSKNLESIAQLQAKEATAFVLTGDARSMPLVDGTVDLIVTSPPYANAIDYMRAHKFSLAWLGESIASLSELRAKYIGSERVGGSPAGDAFPTRPEAIIQTLAERDTKKATILRKYFAEMRLVLAEMYRVLRGDSTAIVVVGPSTMRGLRVPTHDCVADIAAGVSFEVVGVVKRILDRNKRMMPARFGKKTESTIEQRMHEEYVIGLYKRSQKEQHADS
jgi:DNA modification methylase